jgi:hypothetical protein
MTAQKLLGPSIFRSPCDTIWDAAYPTKIGSSLRFTCCNFVSRESDGGERALERFEKTNSFNPSRNYTPA